MIVQEAVKTLEKRGMKVVGLKGTEGWRYQISLKSGKAYQISEVQLLELEADGKLSWSGVVEIATTEL
jgi:hypothetical protein